MTANNDNHQLAKDNRPPTIRNITTNYIYIIIIIINMETEGRFSLSGAAKSIFMRLNQSVWTLDRTLNFHRHYFLGIFKSSRVLQISRGKLKDLIDSCKTFPSASICCTWDGSPSSPSTSPSVSEHPSSSPSSKPCVSSAPSSGPSS